MTESSNRSIPESVADVRLSLDLTEVDWQQLKNSLAADDFDNGRTPKQLEKSFKRSHLACVAWFESSVAGTARALSDSVCNAYIVDVWTRSDLRQRGIATAMLRTLLSKLEGQHVALFAEERGLYKKLGFRPDNSGQERIVGEWLRSPQG